MLGHAELEMMRKLLRDEFEIFANEKLSQVSSCMEQTAKLQEQLAQLLAAGQKLSSLGATSSYIPSASSIPDFGAKDASALVVKGRPKEPTADGAISQASSLTVLDSTDSLGRPRSNPDNGDKAPVPFSRGRRVSYDKFSKKELMKAPAVQAKMQRRVSMWAGGSDVPDKGESDRSQRSPRSPRSPSLDAMQNSNQKRWSVSLFEPLFHGSVRGQKKYSSKGSTFFHRDIDHFRKQAASAFCSAVVQSRPFTWIIGTAILANSIVIGIQTDYMATHSTTDVPMFFYYAEAVFCVVFLFDISIRLSAYGCQFFTGPDWKWNLFDGAIVLLQLVEDATLVSAMFTSGKQSIQISEETDGTRVLRVLRIFRLLRVLRLGRIVHVISEFQAICVAIASSMRSLCWTIVLLLLLIYMFSVCLTQVVTDHLNTNKVVPHEEELRFYYGSLVASMLSCFKSVSEGIHWGELTTPLSPAMQILFILYIAFVSFALMNMLTGIFVDKALQSGQSERRRFLLSEIRAIFTSGDNVQKSGKVTWADFQAHLEDPHLQSYLHAIDVDKADAHELFYLLDAHQDGSVEVEEFVNGCLSLDGPAKAIDLAAFVKETRHMNEKWIKQAQFVNKSLVQICKSLAFFEQNGSVAGA